jgi:hypothetical protein
VVDGYGTDQATRQRVQLGIEYDPRRPTAALNGAPSTETRSPAVMAQQLKATLADKPLLLAKLTG